MYKLNGCGDIYSPSDRYLDDGVSETNSYSLGNRIFYANGDKYKVIPDCDVYLNEGYANCDTDNDSTKKTTLVLYFNSPSATLEVKKDCVDSMYILYFSEEKSNTFTTHITDEMTQYITEGNPTHTYSEGRRVTKEGLTQKVTLNNNGEYEIELYTSSCSDPWQVITYGYAAVYLTLKESVNQISKVSDGYSHGFFNDEGNDIEKIKVITPEIGKCSMTYNNEYQTMLHYLSTASYWGDRQMKYGIEVKKYYKFYEDGETKINLNGNKSLVTISNIRRGKRYEGTVTEITTENFFNENLKQIILPHNITIPNLTYISDDTQVVFEVMEYIKDDNIDDINIKLKENIEKLPKSKNYNILVPNETIDVNEFTYREIEITDDEIDYLEPYFLIYDINNRTMITDNSDNPIISYDYYKNNIDDLNIEGHKVSYNYRLIKKKG